MSLVKVLYRGRRGIMFHDKNKPMFPSRESAKKVNIGLGVVREGTLVDKGKYGFVEIDNIFSVIPESYYSIDYFENIGVPKKVYKGVYGDSVFLKEVYNKRTFIKAFSSEGDVLVQEVEKYNDKLNIYYAKLDNVISNWEDITDEFYSKVLSDIRGRKGDVSITNGYALYAISKLGENTRVLRTKNGVLLVEGKHETLVIWNNGGKVSMSWYGRRIVEGEKDEDVTELVELQIKESGLR